MKKPIAEPTELVKGMSHKEMLSIMLDNGIFCGHDKFARILMDAQQRAIRSMIGEGAGVESGLQDETEDSSCD